MNRRDKTPASLGFTMPAEWERHEGTWLSWPKDPVTFPGKSLDAVEEVFIKAIKSLQDKEKVFVLVDNKSKENYVKERLSSSGAGITNIYFHRIKSMDVWVRDYGPTFVRNRQTNDIAAVKWRFNAWGGKYKSLMSDDKAGMHVSKVSEVRIFRPDIVVEGGVTVL